MNPVNAPRRAGPSWPSSSGTDRATDAHQQLTAELRDVLNIHDELSEQRALVALRALRAIREADKERELDALASAIPTRTDSHWDDIAGPFYSVAAFAKRLGVTRQAVHDRIKRGTLLATTTADNIILIPAFQFDESNTSLPLLKDLRIILVDVAPDAWALALWLNTPVPGELNERSPAQALREPNLREHVLLLAHRDAVRAAQ